MRNKKEKTTLKETNYFSDLDAVAMKEYLEEKALEGWRLKEVDNYIYFEKAEPKKIVYSVNFCRYETVDVDTEKSIVESTKAEALNVGWTYVSFWQGLLFFCTEDDSDLPSVKDINIEIKSRRTLRNICNTIIILLWIILFPLLLWYGINTMFTKNIVVLALFDFILMSYYSIRQIRKNNFKNRFYKEGKKKECGRTLEQVKKSENKFAYYFCFFCLALIICGIVFFVLSGKRPLTTEVYTFVTLIIIITFIAMRLAFKKIVTYLMRAIIIVLIFSVFSDFSSYHTYNIRFDQKFLGIDKTCSIHEEITLFASKHTLYIDNEEQRAETVIYNTQSVLIKKSFLAAHLSKGEYHNNAQKAVDSGAEEVFEGKGKDGYEIVFVYENIIIISNESSITITPADIKIINNL